ncbi:hypothetical protein [Bacillus sp. FJAT-26390]|uniref:hypothetical protein n=1 Tax=Bacillus sp. FJAT-26390 TaxID=1743142 RepID=UPI000807D028|nr:hypothetical protein [Bacillus sp. FJAT-26390]OBZ09134.1 hypothetical protein A7975_23760 [Bacillus sp. FJAT-26390]
MIANEGYYREMILSTKEEIALESGITRSILYLLCSFVFLAGSLIFSILSLIYLFINTGNSVSAFFLTMLCIILSFVLLVSSERDTISDKRLNEKLYIYFGTLGKYIESEKNRYLIWIVNRRVLKYLHELEKNSKNLFFNNESIININLIVDIRKLLNENLISLLKNGNKNLVIELIQCIKKAHLSSLFLSLNNNDNTEILLSHSNTIQNIKIALEACQSEKTENEDNLKLKKVLAILSKPSFLITIIVLVGIGLAYYINTTNDYTKMPANLAVVALVLTITFYVLQNKKSP